MLARSRSIQFRILTRLVPLVAVLFVAGLFWLGSVLSDILYSSNLEVIKRSSTMVVHAIQTSMLAERNHEVWSRVVTKLPPQENTEIEIVDTDGDVLFSSSGADSRHKLRDPMCVVCHEDGSHKATRETVFQRDPDDDRTQVLAVPLRNTSECQSCHAGEKLGMVLVRRSLEPIHDQISTIQLALALTGGVALLLGILATRLLLHRHLTRPLKRLVAGARALGAGDLRHPITLPEPSELTVLANTLNQSAGRLEQMLMRLGRQRDDFETLYRLVDQLGRSILPGERRLRSVELVERILGRPCLLIQAPTQAPAGPCEEPLVAFRNLEGELVNCELPRDANELPLPSPASHRLLERWRRGELEGQTVATEGHAIAYPLRRHGQRLGVLIASEPVEETEGARTFPDQQMVEAMCKHLAIALEFSSLQREFVEQERLAAIGETLAGVVHCLKNMLNGLRAGQYVVDRALELDDREKLLTGWRVMKNSVRQIEQLVFDMLYYVRDRLPQRKPCNVNEVIREVVEVLEELARGRGVRLVAQTDEQLGEESLDRTLLYRALLNLVTNAVDACTESETGDLVVVKSCGTPGEIALLVEDNGTGMSEAVQARLFKRFFSTKATGGTGLGVSVVKKIAEDHGGCVEVESQLGKGSVFRIRLPR